MDHIKTMEEIIVRYETDLKIMITASKGLDRIKTASIKVKFQDLVAESIMNLGKNITDLKEFIKEEKVKLKGK